MPRRHRETRFYTDGAFQCFIPDEQAEQGLEDGTYEPVYEQRGVAFFQIGVQKPVRICSSSDPTPCHITAEESRINALGKAQRMNGQPLLPEDKVRFGEAELKIRMWPRIRDLKAAPRVVVLAT